jgi:mRNA interferase MazF
VQNSAVINNSERRKEDENREKTTHRITFGALRRSFGALQRACRRMEQGGTRPSLILQNDIGNRHSPTTIVAAITGRKTKAALPTHVKIMAKGLKTESTVLLEQIRTIDKARLGEYIGRLDSKTLAAVDRAIVVSLGIKYLEELLNG